MEKEQNNSSNENTFYKKEGNNFKKNMNKRKTYIFLIVLGAIIIFGGFYLFNGESLLGSFYLFNQEKSELVEEEIVATVNGQEITENSVKQIQEQFEKQGQQISEKDAVEQAIDLILITEKAEKEGYSVTKEEVEQILSMQLKQQEQTLDFLKEEIENQGMDYDDLLEDYGRQLIIQEYLENNVFEKVKINDSEVKDFYEQNKQFLGENESFEELEGELRNMIEQQEQQQLIMELIQELRNKSEIDYFKEFEEPEPPQIQINPEQIEQADSREQIETQDIQIQ